MKTKGYNLGLVLLDVYFQCRSIKQDFSTNLNERSKEVVKPYVYFLLCTKSNHRTYRVKVVC